MRDEKRVQDERDLEEEGRPVLGVVAHVREECPECQGEGRVQSLRAPWTDAVCFNCGGYGVVWR